MSERGFALTVYKKLYASMWLFFRKKLRTKVTVPLQEVLPGTSKLWRNSVQFHRSDQRPTSVLWKFPLHKVSTWVKHCQKKWQELWGSRLRLWNFLIVQVLARSFVISQHLQTSLFFVHCTSTRNHGETEESMRLMDPRQSSSMLCGCSETRHVKPAVAFSDVLGL